MRRMTAKQTLTSIDLFAGAGGLSEGLSQAGFRCGYANELVDAYASTYAWNHQETRVDASDIRTVDPARVRSALGLKRGELSLLAGGPPCQGFSINAPSRSADDARNHLFRDYLRFVDEFFPHAVLIENVPGLVSFSGGSTLEAILTALDELGYQAGVRILYAPHYGVPQTRWRTIIIGTRAGVLPGDAFPAPEYRAPGRVNFTSRFLGASLVQSASVGARPHVTVREALSDLPALRVGGAHPHKGPYVEAAKNPYQAVLRDGSPGVMNHEAPRLSSQNLERLRHIPPGGNWTDIPHDLLPLGMQRARRSDHTKRYGRLEPEGLSSTVLTKCDPHWGAYFHYEQDRSLTVREAARLQSFPDRFEFLGPRVAQFEQVGNAVPPLLGRAIGSSIATAFGASVEELAV